MIGWFLPGRIMEVAMTLYSIDRLKLGGFCRERCNRLSPPEGKWVDFDRIRGHILKEREKFYRMASLTQNSFFCQSGGFCPHGVN